MENLETLMATLAPKMGLQPDEMLTLKTAMTTTLKEEGLTLTKTSEMETQTLPTTTEEAAEAMNGRLHPVRQVGVLATYLRDKFPNLVPELNEGDPSPVELAITLLDSFLDSADEKGGDMLKRMWEMQIALNEKTFASNPGDQWGGCTITFSRLLEIGKVVKEKTLDGSIRDIASVHANLWVQQYTRAMQQECCELMDSTNWKWWRTKVDKFDPQNVWVELIDILHFWMSACMVMGLTPADVFKMYMQKNDVNFGRQESGYIEKDENDSKHLAPDES